MITEFLREGFARIGILRDGIASLDNSQRQMLVTDGVTPNSGAAQSGVAKLRDEASAKLGAAKEALMNIGRRTRKPFPTVPM